MTLRLRLYLLLSPLLDLLWCALVLVLYVAGLFGQLVLLSFPNIVLAQLLLRPIGGFDRWMARSLLGQTIPEPEAMRYQRSAGHWYSRPQNVLRRGFAAFQDSHSWRVLAWLLARVVLGPVGFVLLVLPAVLLLAPVAVLLGGSRWLLAAPLGLLAWPLLRKATMAVVGWHRRLAVWALGPGRAELALARAAKAEEQVRLDQELHDSIGHMLSMIVVQAGAGAHVIDKDPEFARTALSTIEERGRAALGELDRIISGIPLAPLPDQESLPALIAGARQAGMRVAARIEAGELPPSLGRSAYRIVQEALTNAAKHAPGAAVRVEVAAGQEVLALSVVNGHSGGEPIPGRGLASIRDRASLLGGRAAIGVSDQGDFAVHALLPLATRLPPGVVDCTLARECACLGCTVRNTVLA